MAFDIDVIKRVYSEMSSRIENAKKIIGKPLTLSEKVLYSHLWNKDISNPYKRGVDYVDFGPDRVTCQDATAQMALLQFMQAGKQKVAVPTTVHCDHLILAQSGAKKDLQQANKVSSEVFDFLESTSKKYGIGFWKPGAGIIHQVVLENYAFPGGMMIGTDSHTVNAGGLGMVAIGVGGADAVDVMAGMPWELKFPKLIGVHLKGNLNGWSSAKDVILKVAGILTVKGGTGAIIEYFGEGAKSLSCTGKGTICNMGAEVGATTSIFGYDESMERYLNSTGRTDVVKAAEGIKHHLTADPEVYSDPEKYFDQVIEINLDELSPHLNGPFTPDLATPVSEMKEKALKEKWPLDVDWGLIGSCTNSSYEDLSRAASIAFQAKKNKLKIKSKLGINPGSEQVRYTAERDGLIKIFEDLESKIFTNACGPCIGQWSREGEDNNKKNSIVHSFNRNFAKRNDGNPNTHAFVSSPEMVMAIALSGRLDFNPITDTLTNSENQEIKLDPPIGDELPKNGFSVEENGYVEPPEDGSAIEIKVKEDSQRLQLLEPFKPWDGRNISNARLLIKAHGKCTTDHISMAGPWLRFRGHLDNISDNCLIGAVNAFNMKTNSVKNLVTGDYGPVPETQRFYKKNNIDTIVVGDHNYGEGSSREHAAMEPRHLGVKAVIVKSFARIHETNLKKQGMLALTFNNESDYDKIQEDDLFNFVDLTSFKKGDQLSLEVVHSNGDKEIIKLNHTFNNQQIEWFKNGSALNLIKSNE
mgnify:FL=1